MTLSHANIWLAVGSITVYHVCFALLVLCTPRNSLVARVVAALAVTGHAYVVYLRAIVRLGSAHRRAPPLGILLVHWLSLAEYLLISRVDVAKLSQLAAQDPRGGGAGNSITTANDGNGSGKTKASISKTYTNTTNIVTTRQRIWQALSLSCNARRLGTEWEVKNVYSRSGSRRQFLLHVVPRTALSYLVIDALMQTPMPAPHLTTLTKSTAWRLWTLTGEDLVFRAISVAMFWFITYVILYLMIHVVAILSVVLGLSTPEFWPHLFGPLRELHTVRGFWGIFWHQRLRKPLTGFADVFTDNILCIPRRTALSTYTRLFFVFALSGLLHHPLDIVQGHMWREPASVAFFLMQPLGIMAEDAVQATTRAWLLPRVVRSVAGYVWVALFLFSTTPTWFFAIQRLGTSPNLLPIPVVEPLGKVFTSLWMRENS